MGTAPSREPALNVVRQPKLVVSDVASVRIVTNTARGRSVQVGDQVFELEHAGADYVVIYQFIIPDEGYGYWPDTVQLHNYKGVIMIASRLMDAGFKMERNADEGTYTFTNQNWLQRQKNRAIYNWKELFA